uniref:Mitochondrial S-adenosylmethionine carrier protein n=1 Tax=Gopherus evgoodei TaxID=1825980 RepID=A0A8C4VVC0_9SAUR
NLTLDTFYIIKVACLIRVPSEVVKQRAQVSPSSSTFQVLSNTLYQEGIQGLYRGYKSTVLREVKHLFSVLKLFCCTVSYLVGKKKSWYNCVKQMALQTF